MPLKPDQLLTSHEAGKLLQMDPSSVVKWVNDGLLPAYRTPGGHRRIKTSDLVAFLRAHNMYVPTELGSGRARVLVVEDDTRLLASLQRALKNHPQVEVLAAASGVEALVQVGAVKPEVLVLDVRMSGLDGFEVCRQLKQAVDTARIEVVMAAGRPTPDLERKAREAGARALIGKPFSPAELVQLVSPSPAASM